MRSLGNNKFTATHRSVTADQSFSGTTSTNGVDVHTAGSLSKSLQMSDYNYNHNHRDTQRLLLHPNKAATAGTTTVTAGVSASGAASVGPHQHHPGEGFLDRFIADIKLTAEYLDESRHSRDEHTLSLLAAGGDHRDNHRDSGYSSGHGGNTIDDYLNHPHVKGGSNSSSNDANGLSNALSLNSMRHKVKAMKQVSGAQFKFLARENHRCENCDELDRMYKKAKETVRGLKLQITRLEDEMCGLKKLKTSDLRIDGSHSGSDDASVLKEQLQRKCDEQEVELSKLRKALVKERHKNDELNEKYRHLTADFQSQKTAWDAQCAKLASENEELVANVGSFKSKVAGMQSHIDDLEARLADCMRQLQCRKDLPDLSSEVERLRKDNFNVIETNKSISNDLLRLNKTVLDMSQHTSALEAAKLEAQNFIKSQSAALADANLQMETLRTEMESAQNDRKRSQLEKEGLESELSTRDRSMKALVGDKEQLRAELDKQSVRLTDLWKRMMNDSEATKKALELAIAGSLRLCVVAPTVNVHVSDRKLRFKSVLPDKALKDFLVNEVLSKYSFLFRQDQEDVAPDGSGLQTWIHKMLGDMQSSIEQHVNSAMDGTN